MNHCEHLIESKKEKSYGNIGSGEDGSSIIGSQGIEVNFFGTWPLSILAIGDGLELVKGSMLDMLEYIELTELFSSGPRKSCNEIHEGRAMESKPKAMIRGKGIKVVVHYSQNSSTTKYFLDPKQQQDDID
ncbi:hypothetical protein IHE45_04G008500 [Dioscorea alata]|uniref:Uncharacterized protein n=1 Tax=Dioscorea alata TaxID=55571 RepID=A0ACB7WAX9_DIOAL|nr:hypothetical protein IHE45_04G008500 [Dioscorea alata]